MTLRHHLVTMTNGKSLVKTNRITIHSHIAFLVWIVFFHSTSCNAFVFGVQASQRSPKMPSKTILLLNDGPAHFKQLPVLSNSPAIITSSFLQLPVDSPAKQHPVSNNDSALIVLQICIPITTASNGLQADNDHHSILNDVTETPIWHQAFDNTLSRRLIVNVSNITSIPALNVLLTSKYLHPAGGMMAHTDATPTSLLLFHVKDDTVITTATHEPSLLLLYIHDNPAIMTALSTQNLLLFLFKMIQLFKPPS
jgi:hypothetical protein